MSTNRLATSASALALQAALTNEWLDQQGVPNLQATWIAYHYPSQTTPTAQASRTLKRNGNQIGTAEYGPVRSVVWGPGVNHSRLPD